MTKTELTQLIERFEELVEQIEDATIRGELKMILNDIKKLILPP